MKVSSSSVEKRHECANVSMNDCDSSANGASPLDDLEKMSLFLLCRGQRDSSQENQKTHRGTICMQARTKKRGISRRFVMHEDIDDNNNTLHRLMTSRETSRRKETGARRRRSSKRNSQVDAWTTRYPIALLQMEHSSYLADDMYSVPRTHGDKKKCFLFFAQPCVYMQGYLYVSSSSS